MGQQGLKSLSSRGTRLYSAGYGQRKPLEPAPSTPAATRPHPRGKGVTADSSDVQSRSPVSARRVSPASSAAGSAGSAAITVSTFVPQTAHPQRRRWGCGGPGAEEAGQHRRGPGFGGDRVQRGGRRGPHACDGADFEVVDQRQPHQGRAGAATEGVAPPAAVDRGEPARAASTARAPVGSTHARASPRPRAPGRPPTTRARAPPRSAVGRAPPAGGRAHAARQRVDGRPPHVGGERPGGQAGLWRGRRRRRRAGGRRMEWHNVQGGGGGGIPLLYPSPAAAAILSIALSSATRNVEQFGGKRGAARTAHRRQARHRRRRRRRSRRGRGCGPPGQHPPHLLAPPRAGRAAGTPTSPTTAAWSARRGHVSGAPCVKTDALPSGNMTAATRRRGEAAEVRPQGRRQPPPLGGLARRARHWRHPTCHEGV